MENQKSKRNPGAPGDDVAAAKRQLRYFDI